MAHASGPSSRASTLSGVRIEDGGSALYFGSPATNDAVATRLARGDLVPIVVMDLDWG